MIVGIPAAYHPKTNSKFAPENQWLEDETSFLGAVRPIFMGELFVSGRIYATKVL